MWWILLKTRIKRYVWWSMMHDVWCMMYNVPYTVYDVWCTMYDVWCRMFDVWCMLYGRVKALIFRICSSDIRLLRLLRLDLAWILDALLRKQYHLRSIVYIIHHTSYFIHHTYYYALFIVIMIIIIVICSELLTLPKRCVVFGFWTRSGEFFDSLVMQVHDKWRTVVRFSITSPST